jgi:Rrf2 family protein
MQLTHSADRGVRAMTHVAALGPGRRVNAVQLADATGTSRAFLGKIMQRLVAARLVVSHRGRDGGFELARPARDISLLDVVTALEGRLCLNQCLPGGTGCDRSPWCAVHLVWAEAQAALARVLASASIENLAQASARSRAALDRSLDRSHV